jgi:predicted amidohydrolase
MGRTTLIAAVQMISGPEVAPNLVEASRLIAEAAVRGASLVALPEYFPLIGASDAARLAASESFGEGPIQSFLGEHARQHEIWLVGGSIPLHCDDTAKVRNACLVFDTTGRCVARYDKIHLFGFRSGDERYDEAEFCQAGSQVVAFDTPFGRVGLGICYDLRFPELFRSLGEIDLLVLPSAFTGTTGRAHWECLLRARAIENQCYVLAPAQGGEHPGGRITHGNSMVIDPWGEVLARLDKGPGCCLGELDPARIEDIRRRLPALKHRTMKHS